MKSIIIYGRALDENDKQLYAACKKIIDKAILARIMDMSACIETEKSRFWYGDQEITGVDLCFLRSFGPGSCEQITRRISMIEHLEIAGTHVVNPTYAYRKVKDKYSMSYTLAKSGLPIPKTYVTEMASWAYRASQGFSHIVYKPIVGALGFGSMKFDDPDMAFNAFKTLERLGHPLYIQEYLDKPSRDIRVFVLGDEVLASIYRIASKDNWKTNVAQGSQVEALKLSDELREISLKAVKAVGLLYAGVDIIETINGPVILEVNASPSWQGLQHATGINVADCLVRFTVDFVKH
jgi:ribosomal protein S6--L-glutamate ligase